MTTPTDPFSDSSQAERACRELFEGRFIWVPGLGWLAYDGTRWAEATEDGPLSALRAWTRERLVEASAVVDAALFRLRADDTKEALAEWQRRTKVETAWKRRRSAAALKAVMSLARGIALVAPDKLDANPDLLNCRNGTLVFPWGDLIPHDPGHYLTRVTACDYNPAAVHEDWNRALDAVPPDVEPWLRVRYGQGITGHMCPDDKVLIQQGGGWNGKSTVLTGVARALGDYYLMASDKILMASHSAEHTTDLADLRGARFVAIEETPETGRLDVVRLKKLAGTERITARKMRQDNVSFPATHTLFVNTNYPPAVGETDDGTWRRLLLVTFPYRFTNEPEGELDRQGDPGLRYRLKAGAEGQHEAVLAWLVEGALAWYAGRREMPAVPASVAADTAEWRGRTDHIAAFWFDHLDPDPTTYIYAGHLIWHFNNYLRQHGNAPVAESTFIRRFRTHPDTVGHCVEQTRIRTGSRQRLTLSEPHGAIDPFARQPGVPSGQIQVWTGVRFRGSAENSWAPDTHQDHEKGL